MTTLFSMITESAAIASSWKEFPSMFSFYVLFTGLIRHVIVYFIVCFVMGIMLIIKKRTSSLGGFMWKFAQFMVVLLIVSGAFNSLWNCTIWGRLYETFGADTEMDFSPFVPLTQDDILEEHGRLLSATNLQLQFVWLIFAVSAWGISFVLYRLINMTRPHFHNARQ
jgi:hypothetical protein